MISILIYFIVYLIVILIVLEFTIPYVCETIDEIKHIYKLGKIKIEEDKEEKIRNKILSTFNEKKNDEKSKETFELVTETVV